MKYERKFTQEEIEILENDLVDIKQWIDDAITGKINKCRKRIMKKIVSMDNLEELTKVDNNPVRAYLKSKHYKPRKSRTGREQKDHDNTILKENT